MIRKLNVLTLQFAVDDFKDLSISNAFVQIEKQELRTKPSSPSTVSAKDTHVGTNLLLV